MPRLTRPQKPSHPRPIRRSIRFKNRYTLEPLEPRQLLTSLVIGGNFEDASHFVMNLSTDNPALAANGTIAIDWGDNSGDIIYGTGNPILHTYADTAPHTVVAYAADSLSLAAGDSRTLNDPDHRVLLLDNLTLGAGSILDITDHDLVLGHASLAGVQAAILAGFGFGQSGDPAITSSAAGDTHFLTPIDQTLTGPQWDNTTLQGNSLVIIKYAYFGDVNLDGAVTGDDLVSVLGSLNTPTSGLDDISSAWTAGDINLDGMVNGDDFIAILGALNSGSNAPRFLIAEAYDNPDNLHPGEALATSNPLHINDAQVTAISSPANAGGGNLAYTVAFNKPVLGVDASDFALQTTGTITGQQVLSITGSGGAGTSYTVTVAPGTGWGTLELDVVDDDTIHDAAGNPLGGTGLGNGSFYGPELKPAITFTGSTTQTEGTAVSFSLGTDHYTLPAGSAWSIDWGDGVVDSLTGSTVGDAHSYTSGDGTYDVSVSVIDTDGAYLYSDFMPVTVVPAEPAGFAATDNGDGTATLTWDTSSALSLWSRVEVSEDRGGYTLLADGVSPTDGTFLADGLAAGSSYSFRLTAYNVAGDSAGATAAVTAAPVSNGQLDPQDDQPSQEAQLGFEANFYGVRYSSVWVNNNGNVTFGQALSGYTPATPLDQISIPMIAPFFADVDTRRLDAGDPNSTGGTVTWAAEVYGGHPALAVHWTGVDYYNRLGWAHTPLSNTFTLHLVSRSDTGLGNFDIVFEYGALNWDTGDVSGGTGGQAAGADAHPARAGFTNGSRIAGTYEELGDSGTGSVATALSNSTTTYAVRQPRLRLSLSDDNFAKASTVESPSPAPLGYLRVLDGEDGRGHVTLKLERLSAENWTYDVAVIDTDTNVTMAVGVAGNFDLVLHLTPPDGKYVARVSYGGNVVTELRFFVAPIRPSVLQVASDQFSGHRENATGPSRFSILMGDRADGHGYLAVQYQLLYRDPTNNRIYKLDPLECPAWVHVFAQLSSDGSHRTTAYFDTPILGRPDAREADIQITSVTGLDKWNVAIGIDANRDGSISDSEVKLVYGNALSNYVVEVNKATYDSAVGHMEGLSWGGFFKPYAGECLDSFLESRNNGFFDHTGRLAVQPDDRAFAARWGVLDNAVGWNASLGDTLPLYVFDSDNPFTQAIVADSVFREQVNKLILDPNRAAMAGIGSRTYTLAAPANLSIDLYAGIDNIAFDHDVHLAIGKFVFNGSVTATFFNDTLTSIEFQAMGNDLYDWEFKSQGDTDTTCAEIQAGFGTLGSHGAICANSWLFQQNISDWSYTL